MRYRKPDKKRSFGICSFSRIAEFIGWSTSKLLALCVCDIIFGDPKYPNIPVFNYSITRFLLLRSFLDTKENLFCAEPKYKALSPFAHASFYHVAYQKKTKRALLVSMLQVKSKIRKSMEIMHCLYICLHTYSAMFLFWFPQPLLGRAQTNLRPGRHARWGRSCESWWSPKGGKKPPRGESWANHGPWLAGKSPINGSWLLGKMNPFSWGIAGDSPKNKPPIWINLQFWRVYAIFIHFISPITGDIHSGSETRGFFSAPNLVTGAKTWGKLVRKNADFPWVPAMFKAKSLSQKRRFIQAAPWEETRKMLRMSSWGCTGIPQGQRRGMERWKQQSMKKHLAIS